MRHVFLVLLSYVAVFLGIGTLIHLVTINRIEHTLEKDTAKVLSSTLHTRTEGVDLDLSNVQVSFAGGGLHGMVLGSVPDDETRTFIEQAVAGINQNKAAESRNIASLTSDLRLSSRCQVFTLNRKPFVRGIMTPAMAVELQAAIKVALKREAHDASKAANNEDETPSPEFLTQNDVDEPSWTLPACEFLKEYLPRTREADFSINNQSIFISGLVDHPEDQSYLIAKAKQLFPGYSEDTIDVSALEVDTPAIPSHIAVRTDTDGLVTIVGQIQNREIADKIADAVQQALQPYQELTNVSLQPSKKAEPIKWLERFEVYTRQLFATVSYPQLNVQGYRVVIGGTVPDEKALDEIIGTTNSQFDDLTLINQLKVETRNAANNAPTPQLSEQVAATDVLFDVNQSSIKASEAPKLETLATLLKAAAGTQVAIFGYADPTGNAAANLRLSLRRCEAARDRLIQLGVDAATLEIVKRGADTSLDANDPSALQQGRRVEFELKAPAE